MKLQNLFKALAEIGLEILFSFNANIQAMPADVAVWEPIAPITISGLEEPMGIVREATLRI